MIDTSRMAEFRIRKIPEELYRKFKAHCAWIGKDVNSRLIELMAEEIDKGDLRRLS